MNRGQVAIMLASGQSWIACTRLCQHVSRRTTRPSCSACHCHFSTNRPLAGSRRATDFNSGFTGSYDPTVESGRGPMFNKSNFGVPQFYPRDLKKRVDEYVVGQDRAKKTICATIFNHYQTVRRRQKHEHEERNARERQMRQKFAREKELHQRRQEAQHPVEGQYRPTLEGLGRDQGLTRILQMNFLDTATLSAEYTNRATGKTSRLINSTAARSFSSPNLSRLTKAISCWLGQQAWGKHTYSSKSIPASTAYTGPRLRPRRTLSKKIQVPFSICDCNGLTQAGYIGQDVETCVERLLIESNYDIKATERGIIVLDEFDKLARRESSTGRDVGGEGVQQALLKLVEGTKVTINVKDNRSSRTAPPISTNYGSTGSSSSAAQANPPGGKIDQYTIDTTNILFVFCGAFVGLDKIIMKRVAKPTIGFGGEVKGRTTLSGSKHALPEEMYAHLAHYTTSPTYSFTPMDLATPADLQSFGFIPELIGRLHSICALSPLSMEDLLRILTEPRNSLVAQYTALFETYPSRLFFTQKALHGLAERAAASGTGARGLKMEMERVLAEPMFDAPMPYVVITEGCVKGKEKAAYWGKDGRFEVDRKLQDEEASHAAERVTETFESYRAAGQSGA